ncbi:MAG: hypothetical protein HQM13_10090 [SAR324 cluster bacterium]|nr:hypothetical protein [SAR324 cluster bacterium]
MYDASRTTIPAEPSQESGLSLNVNQQFRTQARDVLNRLEIVRGELNSSDSFLPLFQSVRAKVIDHAFNGKDPDLDVDSLIKLTGPNKSELDFEIFRPSQIQKCTPMHFEKRTHLKIGRTILNLKELRKAYGGFQLQELEDQLQSYLELSSAFVLRQRLISLSKSSNFQAYLQLKKEFLEEWTESQQALQGKFNATPLVDMDLSDTMKALSQQKPMIVQKPQVLRFTDYQFFRQFNTTTHQHVHSNSLDFWKTEKNRDYFHQMITSIRQKFPVDAPFHIFRFENSFTYFLCGFSDECVSEAILQDQEYAPVHAKIIMRQSNKSYRELQSQDAGNRTLYFNCLKEAMLPFVEELSQRLQMNLPTDFVGFFRV